MVKSLSLLPKLLDALDMTLMPLSGKPSAFQRPSCAAGFVDKPTPLFCLDQRCKKLHMIAEVLKAGKKPVYDDKQFKNYCVPALTYDDVLSAIAKHPKTVHDDHLKKHVEYGKSIDMDIDEPSLN